MRLLGIDFETTGLSPEKDLIIEVGAVVWDTDLHVPVAIDNFFINHNEPITEEITKINGVHQSFLEDFGLIPSDALKRIHHLEDKSSYTVAHNGALFDSLFYRHWHIKVLGHEPFLNRVWIDTQNDVDYPEDFTTRKLTYLAAEHGFLNPFAHRAVFDVLTMMIILDKYPLDEVIHSAQQPTVTIQALVSYDDRDKAKERRFRWDKDNKAWIRSIKKHKIERENFPFPIREVQF